VSVDKAMQVSDWARRPLEEGGRSISGERPWKHLLALTTCFGGVRPRSGLNRKCKRSVTTVWRRRSSRERAEAPPFARIRGVEEARRRRQGDPQACGRGSRAHGARGGPAGIQDRARPGIARRCAAASDIDQEAARAGEPRARIEHGGGRRDVGVYASGHHQGKLSEADAQWLQHPAFDREAAEARKRREKRLMGWRDVEARRRGVNEQVVLPGHCIRRLAEGELKTADQILDVKGLGNARLSDTHRKLSRILQEDTGE